MRPRHGKDVVATGLGIEHSCEREQGKEAAQKSGDRWQQTEKLIVEVLRRSWVRDIF